MLSGLRSFHMGRQPQSNIKAASLRTSYLYLHDPWATPHCLFLTDGATMLGRKSHTAE